MALHEYDYEKEPTVAIVKSILTDAIKMKASDIHFDPRSHDLVIKFRINGDLVEYTVAPDTVKANIITRVKILAGMNITESSIPQIGSINFDYSSKTHNMRVSSIPVIDGEKVVIHLSNYAKNMRGFKSLGLSDTNVHKINDMLKESNGIILITGTNASGKTTTMYSLLQELAKKPLNIISIEDPIKMKIDGVNQVQINPEKGITYSNILKSILESDPNVLAINELINDETTRSALRASVTGRLVISTMNTKTIYTTINTLLNMDVENYLLGSNLIGIISQRLVKHLCPTCREKITASPYEQKVLKEALGEDVTEVYVPKGCEECQDGYVDQIPIVEIVRLSDELRNAISNNRSKELIRNIIYEENDSIIKDGFTKVKNGDTSFEEMMRVIDVRSDLFDDEVNLKNILLGKDTPSNEEEVKEEVKEKKKDKSSKKDESKEDKDTKEETKEVKDNKEEDLLKNALKLMEQKAQEESSKEETTKEEEPAKEVVEEVTEETTKEVVTEVTKEVPKEEVPVEEKTKEEVIEEPIQDAKIDHVQLEDEVKVKEEVKEETPLEPATTPLGLKEEDKPLIIKKDDDDDDDDDDDFNYGDAYINNF